MLTLSSLAAWLPQSCVLCGADAQEALCSDCTGDLPYLRGGCPQCAEPTPHDERCGHCLRTPPAFDRTLALFAYAYPIDRMLQALKYRQQLLLARWFGETLLKTCGPVAADLVAPLPLHPDKLAQRGFNQALEIARPLAQGLGLPVHPELCLRTRATRSQAELPLQERPANVHHAFACTTALKGEHVLLVDDVMTTGATLHECARALKQAGAGSVTAIVVGRAIRH